MRSGAGDKYAAKQGVPKGANVTYMGKMGVWLRVYYSGVTGYVLASEFTKCDYMRGDDVTAIQQALKAVGNDPGVIDGVYGPQSAAAVVAFQTVKGLEIDGIVGPITWAALGL
jgi:peptidoglycan hydrolase-like protein with peptidoglycan-binding domain